MAVDQQTFLLDDKTEINLKANNKSRTEFPSTISSHSSHSEVTQKFTNKLNFDWISMQNGSNSV